MDRDSSYLSRRRSLTLHVLLGLTPQAAFVDVHISPMYLNETFAQADSEQKALQMAKEVIDELGAQHCRFSREYCIQYIETTGP